MKSTTRSSRSSSTNEEHDDNNDQNNNRKEDKDKLNDKEDREKNRMKGAEYLQTALYESAIARSGKIQIGKTVFIVDGRLLTPKENMIAGKIMGKGKKCRVPYIWSNTPPQKQMKIENVPYQYGALGAAREVETELAAFSTYITENMLENILVYTNEQIQLSHYYMLPKPVCGYPMSLAELKALIGILFFFSIKERNKTPLWNISDADIFNTIMSKNRFEYLIQCLRFDDYSTRQQRTKSDSFAEIRQIWDDFIIKCSEVYRPTANCTIDDMFVDFNGKCSFKWPLPKQPQKSGIKLILLCDANVHYVISGIPCLDKHKKDTMIPSAKFPVEKLATPLCGTNTTITYGNDCLTSISLSKKMFNYKLKTVGILHKSLPEIPPDMIVEENRPVGTSIFAYNIDDKLQLCSFYAKKNEITIFISNVNFDPVTEGAEGDPEIARYYNSTKDGVNDIRKTIYSSSCSKQTTHWFLAIFYTILDFAGINSNTILNINRSRYGNPPIKRVDFINKLALDLMLPFLKERLVDPKTSDPIKNKIESIIEIRNSPHLPVQQPKEFLNTTEIYIKEKQTQTKVLINVTTPEIKIIQQNKDSINVNAPEIKDIYNVKAPINVKTREIKEMHQMEVLINETSSEIKEIQKSKGPIQVATPEIKENLTVSTNYLSHLVPRETTFGPEQEVWDSIRDLYSPTPSTKLIQQPALSSPVPQEYCPNFAQHVFLSAYPPTQPNFIHNLPAPIHFNFELTTQNLPNLFVPQNQGIMSCMLYCLNPSMMSLQWSCPFPNIVWNQPNPDGQQMQNRYLPSIPFRPIQSAASGPNLQEPVKFQDFSDLNTQQNPKVQQIQIDHSSNSFKQLFQPSTSVQDVKLRVPSVQPSSWLPHFQIQEYQENVLTNSPNQSCQSNILFLNTQPIPQNIQPSDQYHSPNQAIPSNSTTKIKRELCVCGVCNGIKNQKFFIDCFKCGALLCEVHRKIVCTKCYYSVYKAQRAVINLDDARTLAKGKCSICQPKGKIRYSTKCYKCFKFICLQHRRIVCVFCIDV